MIFMIKPDHKTPIFSHKCYLRTAVVIVVVVVVVVVVVWLVLPLHINIR